LLLKETKSKHQATGTRATDFQSKGCDQSSMKNVTYKILLLTVRQRRETFRQLCYDRIPETDCE